jgi:glycolate oxidase FAD binding subunit
LGASYGLVRDQVLGVTLVTGDGRTLRLGGRVMKNVAGFDLVRLAVGSQGALGVVVSASLRVFPRPAVDRLLVVRGSLSQLLQEAARVRVAPRLPASAILVREASGDTCTLMVRLQGSAAVVDADTEAFRSTLNASPQTLQGDEARREGSSARDLPLSGKVRVRLTARPAMLDALLGGLEGVSFVADVMTGGVTAALSDGSEAQVQGLSRHAVGLRGSALLVCAPPHWRGIVAEEGPAAALAARIRSRFDPNGTLASGRTA